jgi:hypothetical protein
VEDFTLLANNAFFAGVMGGELDTTESQYRDILRRYIARYGKHVAAIEIALCGSWKGNYHPGRWDWLLSGHLSIRKR